MSDYGIALSQFEPRVIRTKKEYRRANDILDKIRGEYGPSQPDSHRMVAALFEVLIYHYEGEMLSRVPVGELLRDELEMRGISQADLGRETGVNPTTISNVINGRRGLSKKDAKAISGYLGMRYEAFLSLHDEED